MSNTDKDIRFGQRCARLVQTRGLSTASVENVIAIYALTVYQSGRRINKARATAWAAFDEAGAVAERHLT